MQRFSYKIGSLAVVCAIGGAACAETASERLDLLTFAQGVLPVSIETEGEALKTGMEHAIAAIDGNPNRRIVTPKPGSAAATVEITYALPAHTRFDRFAVPNVLETPSPSQTFVRSIKVFGASDSATGPFTLLASTELAAHEQAGLMSELTVGPDAPSVRWVKLRLFGGIDVQREQTFYEFSEIVGNGTQEAPPLSDMFSGAWTGRGVNIELAQDGAAVTGCYDKKDHLAGTVQGNVLRALGHDAAGVVSQFVLIASGDGSLRGLRSTNGAPFKPYDGDSTGRAPICLAPEPPTIGCGSVVHGIGFDFDSDALRPDAEPILAKLLDGLSGVSAARIEIVGHSSAEGAADYNRDLSERRAASVVAWLTAMGFDGGTLSASGRGEEEPIASNDDEAGRSLNRRVEIRCAG